MGFTYAGCYSANQVINSLGLPQPSVAVTIYEHATNTLATLYTDRTKATTAANPTTTDSAGNLSFYADPGQYDIAVTGMTNRPTVEVHIDPSEMGAYVPALTDSATLYVTTAGNDAHDGLTWNTAKATIPAAISALPANGGTVMLGYGVFNVSSTGRFDTATFTAGSATVSDTSAAVGDVGSFVLNKNLQDQAYIVSVVPGTSYTLNIPAATSGTSQTVVTQPAIQLPAGVTIRGQGSSYTSTEGAQGVLTHATTAIVDGGSGVTVIALKATDSQTGSQFAVRYGLRSLSVRGNGGNIFGLHADNVWYLNVSDVDFQGHGIAGVAMAANQNSTTFRNCRFIGNGTAAATKVTGGVLLNTPYDTVSAALTFDTCFFSSNYGWGLAATSDFVTSAEANAVTLLNCQFNLTKQTAYGTTFNDSLCGSGTGAWLGGNSTNCVLIGTWFESCDNLCLYVTPSNGAVTAIGCQIGAAGGANGNNSQCVQVRNGPFGLTGQFNAIGCDFERAIDTGVLLDSNVSFGWFGCRTVSITGNRLAQASTDAHTMALTSAAPGVGTVGSVSLMPRSVANYSLTLVAGTVTQADANIRSTSVVAAYNVSAGGTVGALSVTLTAGTGFTINSTSDTDTSKILAEVVSY